MSRRYVLSLTHEESEARDEIEKHLAKLPGVVFAGVSFVKDEEHVTQAMRVVVGTDSLNIVQAQLSTITDYLARMQFTRDEVPDAPLQLEVVRGTRG